MMNFKGEEHLLKIDGTIIKVIVSFLALDILGELATMFSLSQDLKSKKMTIIKETNNCEPESYELDLDKIETSKYKKEIFSFVLFLTNRYPKEILINFYNNFNTLCLKKSIVSILIGASGTYDPGKNCLTETTKSVIIHELFHMASSFYDKNTISARSGFYQYTIPNSKNSYKLRKIGRGLNEGYTQLMTMKYFSKKEKVAKAYPFETNIASILEMIVGEDNMEKLYFKADLMGLVNELQNYASKENIMTFIYYMDIINKSSISRLKFKYKTIQEIVLFIYSFLIKSYKCKLQKDLDNGILSQEQVNINYNLFINSLGDKVKVSNHKYKISIEDKETEDEIYETRAKVLKNKI